MKLLVLNLLLLDLVTLTSVVLNLMSFVVFLLQLLLALVFIFSLLEVNIVRCSRIILLRCVDFVVFIVIIQNDNVLFDVGLILRVRASHGVQFGS